MALIYNVPIAGSSASSSATPLTVLYAYASPAASQTDVAFTKQEDGSSLVGVVNYAIRVLGGLVVADTTASTLRFNTKGAGAGTALSPIFPVSANGGFQLQSSNLGWLKTKSGENLTVNTGGAAVYILIAYVLEPA